MKKILWFFVALLMVMQVYAGPPTLSSSFNDSKSNSSGDYTFYDNCEGTTYNSTLWTTAGAGYVLSGGKCVVSSGNRNTEYARSKPFLTLNQTLDFQFTVSATNAFNIGFLGLSNATATTDLYGALGANVNAIVLTDFGGDAHLDLMTSKDGDGSLNDIVGTADFTNLGTSSTYNMSIYLNSTNGVCGWMNGTSIGCVQLASSTFNQYQIHFAEATSAPIYADNIRIYNGTKAPTAVAAPVIVINNTVPLITITYPIDNQSTLDNFTYPLMINGSVYVQNGSISSLTINNTNFKNYGNNTNFTFQVNGTVSQQKYDVLINATSQYGNSTTAFFIFTVDFNAPTLTGSTFSLNKSAFYIGSNITFQFNYTDNIKLFHINITTKSYSLEITNINQSSFIYNGSINGSTFGLGRHQINTTYCDAHTKNEIGVWNNQKDNTKKEIKFSFVNGDFSIRPKDPTLIETFDTEKKKDRYTFKYTKKANKKSDIQTFVISSTSKIDILGNSDGYYGWLIIKDLKKWVDFNLADGSVPVYRITRIDAYNVEVEMDGLSADSFEFRSAGDLNCNSQSFYYYLFNYTAIYNNPVTESVIETIKLVVDTGGILYRGNSSINYNGVDYVTTNISSNNQVNFTINLNIPQPPSNVSNMTFFWNFDLNSSRYTTINYTQLANRVRLLACSLAEEMVVLNISIFDENNPLTYLEADVDTVFTSWTNDSGNTLNFTFRLRDQTNYSICLAPNTSLNTNAYFQYNVSGGFAQRWFLTNARLNQNTSLAYLYDFSSTTGISTLKGTLKDNTYSFFPLVVTKLQRFYAGENVWRTVQMDKSDDFGLVLFNIIETSTDYRIIFEQNGAELSRTNPSKFKCSSSLCDLTFIVDVQTTDSVANPKFRTGFDNRTKIYQLNFTDTTGLTSSARLRVTKETRGEIITICDQTLTASDGTINCNVTGYDGTLIARVYSSASPEVAKITEYISIVIGKLFQRTNTFVSSNELTFWATSISITLTIAGAIFNPIAGIILYIVSLIGIYAMGLVNFVTVTFITLMACLGIVVGILLNMRKNG